MGDDGQRDPAIYEAFAAAHPDAVEAVAIRTLTRTQRVLSASNVRREEPAVDTVDVSTRWVTVADGYELGSALNDLARGGGAVAPGA